MSWTRDENCSAFPARDRLLGGGVDRHPLCGRGCSDEDLVKVALTIWLWALDLGVGCWIVVGQWVGIW